MSGSWPTAAPVGVIVVAVGADVAEGAGVVLKALTIDGVALAPAAVSGASSLRLTATAASAVPPIRTAAMPTATQIPAFPPDFGGPGGNG